VPVPELGLGEALIAVMASSVNYNTVWSSIFSPVPTFAFLRRYGKLSPLTARHDLPYHVVGSDLAGVVLRTGPGVNAWKPGEEVVAHCLSVELESSDGHNDTMLDPEQRIWGYETNFGGLAELALVKTNQLMPKPKHLTWEEAATPGLVNSTAFRQLVSDNGAAMKQGHNVGQGHDPGIAEAQRRGPPPIVIGRWVRDPLKGWARKDGALAGTFGFQYAPAGGAGLGPEFVQVGQAGAAAQVAGAQPTVSIRIARPPLRYCLIRECL
jgi:Alcohol dehydrogenase GroES-like domain